MSACLHMIVTDMSEFLDGAQLRLILLKAIPERQVRDVYPTAGTRRPGVPYRAPTGPPVQAEVYDDTYSAQFSDPDALEYLEYIRGVVLGVDRDPETLAFLLDEFDRYFEMRAPVFFQSILIIFKKWHELAAGNPPSTADAGGTVLGTKQLLCQLAALR